MSLNDENKNGSSARGLRRATNTVYRRGGRPSMPRGRVQGDMRTNVVDNNGTGTSSPRERSPVSHTRRDNTHEESDRDHRDSHREHARAPSPVKSKPNTRPLSPSPLRDGSTVPSKAAERQSERRQPSPGRFVESPVGSPRKASIPALDDGADRGSGHKFPHLPGPAVPLGTSLDSHPSVSSPLRKETPTSLITGKPFSADAADRSHQQDLQNAGRKKTRSVQSAPPPLPGRHKPAPPPAPVSTPKRPTSVPRGTPRFTEDFDHECKDFMSSNVPASASGAEKKEKHSIWGRIGFRNATDEETRRQDRMEPHRSGISKYFETRRPKDRYETLLGSSDI
ncbi:hypothetical protein ACEPAF_2064 [Sanghuangporus sanghuang]